MKRTKSYNVPGGKGGRVSLVCEAEPPCITALFEGPAAELFESL